MMNFYSPIPLEIKNNTRSAFEIAAAAHEHEKRLVELRTYDRVVRQDGPTRNEAGQASVFSFLKTPLRLLTMAGQWIFMP